MNDQIDPADAARALCEIGRRREQVIRRNSAIPGWYWWAVAVLLNPTLVMAPIIGQLPFLWATAFFFLAIGFWRRDKRLLAALFARRRFKAKAA